MKIRARDTLGLLAVATFVNLFLLSRAASFFHGAWELELPLFAWNFIYAASLALVFFFRKPICELFKGQPCALACAVGIVFAFKFRGVVLNSCAYKGIFSLIGGGLLLGIFILLFISAFKDMKCIKVTRRDIIFTACAALFLNLAGVLYCLNMKRIFVWDNAGYFLTVLKLDALFPGIEYFKEVYRSVFETDYNYIIAFPASIFCKLFGNSRLVFVLSIINCYVLPLILLVYSMSKKVWKTVFVILALPYIMFAANTGFIDIGGVFFALLAAVLFFKEKSVPSGALLALCVLLRRWYSFYALTFIITAFIYCVSNKKIRDFFLLCFSFGFVLLFFAQDFVVSRLLADYSYAYSAYSLGMGTDIKIFTRYFGLLLPVFAVAYSIIKKSFTLELFMTVQGILCFLLFTLLQTHGQQHLALYCPAFLLILLSAFERVKGKGFIALSLCCTFQTVSAFFPRVQPRAISEIKHVSVLPSFTLLPPVDTDAESFLPVAEYVDEIGALGKTVCFLASSVEMNYDTLRNAEISLSRKYKGGREEYYLPISDVDKRDGLSKNLFIADYVLVPSELQIHLAEDEQRVISVPYRYILSGENIGTAYVKEEKEFTLSSGRKIYVYKRKRDVQDREITELEGEIMGF